MLTPAERAKIRVCVRINNEYSNDLRVRREAEALAEAGYDVTVIADARAHLPAEESLAGVKVKRIAKNSRIPFESLIRPLRDENADIYHAHDVDSLLPVTQAVRRAGGSAKIVYDSHELWSAHAKDKLHAKRRVLIALEGPMLRRCDALISVSAELTTTIAEKYGFRGLVQPVMNVPRRYTDAELAPRWAERDADPLTRVAYVGVFQHGRGVVPLVRALEFLPGDVVIELIGPFPQPDYEALAREAAAPYGDRVRFLGRVPAEELVPRLASAKLSAVPIEPISESYRMAAPNKLFDSIAAHTPVVASDLPTIGALTRAENIGLTFDVSQPHDIARAITEALPRLAEFREGCAMAADRYNWDVEKAKLVALYDKLSSRSANA